MKYHELDQKAKDRALAAHADSLDYPWWDGVFEDFVSICTAVGIEIDRGFRNAPDIAFSGFWSQGDGAAFAGRLYLGRVAGAGARIRAYVDKDTGLWDIVDSIEQAVAVFTTTVLLAGDAEDDTDISMLQIWYSDRGYTQSVGEGDWAVVSEELSPVLVELVERITSEITSLSGWLYRALEQEYDYLASEEALIDRDEDYDENGLTQGM